MILFDAASDWYNVSLTISAQWIRTGGSVHYNVSAQPPQGIRSHLGRLGLKTDELEKEDKLRIYDWYSATLGGKSEEKYSVASLKVFELSTEYATFMKSGGLDENANVLRVIDSGSTLARFNDEKLYVEFILTRVFPRSSLWKATLICPFVIGLHSDRFYKALESGADGIIDLRLDEIGNEARNVMRIRNLRNVRFDGKWFSLSVADNFEVTFDK